VKDTDAIRKGFGETVIFGEEIRMTEQCQMGLGMGEIHQKSNGFGFGVGRPDGTVDGVTALEQFLYNVTANETVCTGNAIGGTAAAGGVYGHFVIL